MLNWSLDQKRTLPIRDYISNSALGAKVRVTLAKNKNLIVCHNGRWKEQIEEIYKPFFSKLSKFNIKRKIKEYFEFLNIFCIYRGKSYQ